MPECEQSKSDQGESMCPSAQLRMSSQITYLLAASIIAGIDFPCRRTLPRPLPQAFCNFGHQLLMDYGLLVKIVWQVAESIRQVAGQLKDKYAEIRRKLRVLIAVILVIAILLEYLSEVSDSFIAISWILIAVFVLAYIGWLEGAENYSLIAYLARVAGVEEPYKAKIAEIRADAIQNLLNSQFNFNGSDVSVPFSMVANGSLGLTVMPVLTILHDEHPFPGFGRLQSDTLFSCRQKVLEETPLPVCDLNDLIAKQIIKKLVPCQSHEITCGHVIVIHGDSIAIDSPWLKEDKSPLLWLPFEELPHVHAIDPDASVRFYFAVQLIFPQQLTAATFFVRLFRAGNSVSFQVAVTTLGPPITTVEWLRRKVRHFKQVAREGTTHSRVAIDREDEIDINKLSSADQEGLAILKSANRAENLIGDAGAGLNFEEIFKIDPSEETKISPLLSKRFDSLVNKCMKWPGFGMKIGYCLRESMSRHFAVDFFGKSESFMAVRSVHSELVRLILDTLEHAGYDISEYRSQDGHWSIKADKIDKLIVGESVHFDESKNRKKVAKNMLPDGIRREVEELGLDGP